MTDPRAEPPKPDAPELSEGEATLEEQAYDAYLDAVLEGEAQDLESFLARRGSGSARLRERIEAFREFVARRAKAPARETKALEAPERIGEFRVLRKLGEGGMSVVYLAEQASLGRLVALKVLRPSRTGLPWAQARLRREALAIAKLRHPNVVVVHAAGEEDGTRYLAMELVPGRGLDEWLREAAQRGERLPIPRVLRWIAGIARGLQAAHDAGIVHRDVKPSNVRITPDDQATLLDFGLAHDASLAELTLTGDFRGTPHYASPEQVAARRREIDARTDVYSLGATLYRCVTGRVPFEGETTDQVFTQILLREPEPPRRLDASIPRDLETVVLKAMEKDPARRYASAGAFADDLDALVELRPIRARGAGPIERCVKWARRNRGAAAGIGAAAALLVGAVGLFVGERIVDAREANGLRAETERAVGEGRLDAALALLERRIAARRDDADAILRREEVVRLRNRELARAALEEARAKLSSYRETRRALETKRKDVERGAIRLRASFVPPREAQAQAAAEDALRAETSRLEATYFAFLEDLNRARRHDAELPEIATTLAEATVERWREAVAAGDEAAQSLHAAKIRELDVDGRWSAVLEGRGTLAVAGAPAGAEVHLFRYLPMHELAPGGDRRLVPVPFDPARGVVPTPGVVPGEVALEIEAVDAESPAEAAGLRAGDLVVRIDGDSVEGALFATCEAVDAAGNRALPMDRLTRFEGRELRDYADVYAIARAGGPRRVAATLARGSEEIPFEVEIGSTSETRRLPFAPVDAAEMLLTSPIPTEGVTLTVWSDGAAREIWLEGGGRIPGLRTRPCAYPLFFSAASRAGALPVKPWSLPPGPYLVVLRQDGFETLRLPAFVPREQDARVDATLLPTGSSPEGFLWVAPGPARLGGDPAARTSRDRAIVEVPGFWMARFELTMAEYVSFLSDPETDVEIRRELAASGRSIRVPRDATTPQGMWRRDADGGFSSKAVPLPIFNISAEDAMAYVAWRNRKAQDRGEPWVFALPSNDQWEKAARGVDGRRYPWGDVLQWHFCRNLLSRVGTPFMEPSGAFPRDESPYGVRDLAGNLEEWTLEDPSTGRLVGGRGGNWWLGAADAFAAAARTAGTPGFFNSGIGVRLVARPR